MTRGMRGGVLAAMVLVLRAAALSAHSGPPYPAISDQTAGAYTVAVWTDPDTTDDGSAQGKFWVTLHPAAGGGNLDSRTRVDVSIKPTDRAGAMQSAHADPVRNDRSSFFAALPMNHEGPFAVHVTIDGPLGRADLDCQVQATYDLRPAPMLLLLYVSPFVAVALLWGKLIAARRRARQRR